ncbi:MAG: hypothetical protein IPL33_19250 [Sphingobacteriales bacterium]|nr:hypothetical protein [Sphingobacteriales bacterium]
MVIDPNGTDTGCDATLLTAQIVAAGGLTTTDSGGCPVIITQSPAAGTMVASGSPGSPAVHTITLTATDAAGNTATCNTTFTVTPLTNADWTPPSAQCANGLPITLTPTYPQVNPYYCGPFYGTWSGTGVTDTGTGDGIGAFNPTGLSGNIPITYTIGAGDRQFGLQPRISR